MTDVSIVAVFGAGVASFLNPCVLPLVPVWAGVSLGAAPDGAVQTMRATVPFIGGMAATFALLGSAAGVAGDLADGAGTWLPRIGGVLTVGFGLALLGVGPRWVRGDHRLPAIAPRPGRGTPAIRAVVAGVAAGAAWTPCVGPFLGAALTVAASEGGATRGALLMSAFAAGIGAPFLAAALAADSWPGLTRAIARRTRGLHVAGGAVLVLVGVAMATGTTERLVDPVARLAGGR